MHNVGGGAAHRRYSLFRWWYALCGQSPRGSSAPTAACETAGAAQLQIIICWSVTSLFYSNAQCRRWKKSTVFWAGSAVKKAAVILSCHAFRCSMRNTSRFMTWLLSSHGSPEQSSQSRRSYAWSPSGSEFLAIRKLVKSALTRVITTISARKWRSRNSQTSLQVWSSQCN